MTVWHVSVLSVTVIVHDVLTRVLVTLKHELRVTSRWVPELHASVFGARQDPLAIWRKRDTEHEVLRRLSASCTGNEHARVGLTLWPSKVLMHFPLLVCPPICGPPRYPLFSSHILMVLSKLPETRLVPFGLNATL